MNDRQRRWEELQARWACGERLSVDEERERLDYVALDPIARRELQLFGELRQRATSDDAHVSPALLDSVLDAIQGRPRLRLVTSTEPNEEDTSAKRPPRRRRGLVAAAALVAAALGAVLVTVPFAAPPPPARVTTTTQTARVTTTRQTVASHSAHAELVLSAGEVLIDGQPANVDRMPLSQGQRLTTGLGHACFSIEPASDVCLASNSAVRLESLAVRSIRLQVESGTALASLSRRAPGSTFTLVMAEVAASARGTTFAARRGDGESEVIVLEGTVDVVRGREQPEPVLAHSRVLVRPHVGTLARAPVADAEEASLLGLRSWHQQWAGTPAGVLQLFAATSTALRVSIDAEAPLPLPLQAMVRSGKHRVTWRDAAGRQSSSWIDVPAGETRRVEAPLESISEVPSQPADTQSPAALLKAARHEIARAKPVAALALYERLRAAYPGSAEAHTVLVTMGKLEHGLGRQERALRHFDAYLRRAGALAPEALAGKIRALRALGRHSEERAAIQQYLARHPSGLEAPGFEKRREELGRP
jgi:hypothetical protein